MPRLRASVVLLSVIAACDSTEPGTLDNAVMHYDGGARDGGVCGDGVVDTQRGEECDGEGAVATCAQLFAGGSADASVLCDDRCRIDARACRACGNGVVEPSEECDEASDDCSEGCRWSADAPNARCDEPLVAVPRRLRFPADAVCESGLAQLFFEAPEGLLLVTSSAPDAVAFSRAQCDAGDCEPGRQVAWLIGEDGGVVFQSVQPGPSTAPELRLYSEDGGVLFRATARPGLSAALEVTRLAPPRALALEMPGDREALDTESSRWYIVPERGADQALLVDPADAIRLYRRQDGVLVDETGDAEGRWLLRRGMTYLLEATRDAQVSVGAALLAGCVDGTHLHAGRYEAQHLLSPPDQDDAECDLAFPLDAPAGHTVQVAAPLALAPQTQCAVLACFYHDMMGPTVASSDQPLAVVAPRAMSLEPQDLSIAVCPDGQLHAPEACDDGNREIDDGCDTDCRVEEGWKLQNGSLVAPDVIDFATTASAIVHAQEEAIYFLRVPTTTWLSLEAGGVAARLRPRGDRDTIAPLLDAQGTHQWLPLPAGEYVLNLEGTETEQDVQLIARDPVPLPNACSPLAELSSPYDTSAASDELTAGNCGLEERGTLDAVFRLDGSDFVSIDVEPLEAESETRLTVALLAAETATCPPSGSCLASASGSPGVTLSHQLDGELPLWVVVSAAAGHPLPPFTIDVGKCGNGITESEEGETCDDGNNLDNDGCDANCQAACPRDLHSCQLADESYGCFDLEHDPSNCGTCGKQCPGGSYAVCVAGDCGLACTDAGLQPCQLADESYGCFDLKHDPTNCGTCGRQCPGKPDAVCMAGACGLACPDDRFDCDRATAGCETPEDADNCGGCGARCASDNVAARSCDEGRCQIQCATGFADCNSDLSFPWSDGCEVELQSESNLRHCGADAACAGGAECAADETCQPQPGSGAYACECAPGLSRCGQACVDLSFDRSHCGDCDHDCGEDLQGAGKSCVGGRCVSYCEEGYSDCNRDLGEASGDGCECGPGFGCEQEQCVLDIDPSPDDDAGVF